MRTSYFLIHFCAIDFDIFHNSFFSPVGRIPFCFVREKYDSIANFFTRSFGPRDMTLSYLRKVPKPGKDFSATVSLIITIEVILFIVLVEVESGYIRFYSSLPPDPFMKAVS